MTLHTGREGQLDSRSRLCYDTQMFRAASERGRSVTAARRESGEAFGADEGLGPCLAGRLGCSGALVP